MNIHSIRLAHILKRLLGEEKGAVAMEYIVISLLVAAALVGMVMVFSGNLRNMLGTTNDVMTQKNVEGIQVVGNDYHMNRENQKYHNSEAKEAGNKIGGAFQEVSGGYCEPPASSK